MVRANIFVAAFLFSIAVHQYISNNSVFAQDTIPDTAAGTSLVALLHATNNADEAERLTFLKSGFEVQDDDTVKRRQMQTNQIRSQLGDLSFKKAVSSSDFRISVICETVSGPNVMMTVTVSDIAPHRIQSIELQLAPADGDGMVAMDSPLDETARAGIVEHLARELRAKYVFPDIGETMAASIEKSAIDGEYDMSTDAIEFASQLSKQLLDICHDKHLRVRAGSPRRPGASSGRRPVDNHGFAKAEMLQGGIGYLKFDYFSGDEEAKKTAAAAMNFLANSEALIFDLRENGGGSPEMIAFLSSYLFDEPVHLNSFYNRPTDTTTESWTEKEVPGDKFSPDTPVFVLTSSYTFSGAEEFSYNLKNLKRGTIVGETTGGGAHPVMPVTLGKRMHITMPFARAINPITQTNWEGTGVKPDVEISADQAMDRAIELARSKIAEIASADSEAVKRVDSNSVDQDGLMAKASQFMAEESFAEAIPLFEQLVKFNPSNGEAWFKYGYCLHLNGQIDSAIDAHKRAVEFKPFAVDGTYNLACAYSLKNNVDEAFTILEQAVELGFDDVGQMEIDSDLDNVRKDPRYAEIIKQLKKQR